MLPHSYKIKNNKNGKIYIGVVIKGDKDYLERFKEHISLKGSKSIKEEICSGEYSKEDYSVELIQYYIDSQEALKDEVKLIKKYDSKKSGLNENYGGGFGGYVYIKFEREYCYKLDKNLNDFGLSKIYFNRINCLSKKSEKQKLQRPQIYNFFELVDNFLNSYNFWKNISNSEAFDILINKFGKGNNKVSFRLIKEIHESFLSEKTKNDILEIIIFSDYSKSFVYCVETYIKEKRNVSVLKYKQLNEVYPNFIMNKVSTGFDRYFNSKLFARYAHKGKDPKKSKKWVDGRKKFKKRMESGNFTKKEIEGRVRTKRAVKNDWDNKSYEEKLEKARNGLSSMNKKNIACPHCKKSGLTKGNAKRWHFDNCKSIKEKQDNGLFES